jgi:hypothetical protein
MGWSGKLIKRFRKLPTPLLAAAVLSRFVFGLGMGATLASTTMRRRNWKLIGGVLMALGTLLVVPAGRRVWNPTRC